MIETIEKLDILKDEWISPKHPSVIGKLHLVGLLNAFCVISGFQLTQPNCAVIKCRRRTRLKRAYKEEYSCIHNSPLFGNPDLPAPECRNSKFPCPTRKVRVSPQIPEWAGRSLVCSKERGLCVKAWNLLKLRTGNAWAISERFFKAHFLFCSHTPDRKFKQTRTRPRINRSKQIRLIRTQPNSSKFVNPYTPRSMPISNPGCKAESAGVQEAPKSPKVALSRYESKSTQVSVLVFFPFLFFPFAQNGHLQKPVASSQAAE